MGVEAEGRLRGVRTLFIEGPDVPQLRLGQDPVAEKCSHIYLGANGRPLSVNGLRDLAADLESGKVEHWLVITVEVPAEMAPSVPREVYARCRVILNAKVPEGVAIAPDVEVKLTGERTAVVLTPVHRLDLTYVLDRGVEP